MDKEARIKRIQWVMGLNKKMQSIDLTESLESQKPLGRVLLGLGLAAVIFKTMPSWTFTLPILGTLGWGWFLVGLGILFYAMYHLMTHQYYLGQEIAEETNQRLEKKLKEMES